MIAAPAHEGHGTTSAGNTVSINLVALPLTTGFVEIHLIEVDEAANMVAWLVSKENSFTTASVFDLSGGRATY